jgi:hypothetical protein
MDAVHQEHWPDQPRRRTDGLAVRRALFILLAVVALVPPVGATTEAVHTYFVNGAQGYASDSNDGFAPDTTGRKASTKGPWRTIGKANPILSPGDVLNVLSLAPADSANLTSNRIWPAKSGGGTPSTYIRYVGNITNPELLPVPAVYCTTSWVSVAGFRSKEVMRIVHAASNYAYGKANQPRGDSISYCVMQTFCSGGGRGWVFYRNHIKNTTSGNFPVLFGCNGWAGQTDPFPCGSPSNFISTTFGGTFRRNLVEMRVKKVGGPDKGFETTQHTQGCLVDSNTITGLFTNPTAASNGGDEIQALEMFYSSRNRFQDNRWVFDVDTTGSHGILSQFAGSLRDSSFGNVFRRDTMLVGLGLVAGSQTGFSFGGDYLKFMIEQGGHEGQGADSCVWDSCFYRSDGGFEAEGNIKQYQIKNSVFSSLHGVALLINNTHEALSITHNTIIKNGNGPALSILQPPTQPSPPTAINHNLIVCDSVWSQYDYHLSYCPSWYGASAPVAEIPWIGPAELVMNENLLFAAYTSLTARHRSELAISDASNNTDSIGAASCWCSSEGHDCNSAFVNPHLISWTWASMNPRWYSTTSACDSSIFGPGDWVGAYAAIPVCTAPDSVANLSVSPSFAYSGATSLQRFDVFLTTPAQACSQIEVAAAFADTVMADGDFAASIAGVEASPPTLSQLHFIIDLPTGVYSTKYVIQVRCKVSCGLSSSYARYVEAGI